MDRRRHKKRYEDTEEFISSREQTPTTSSNQQHSKQRNRNTIRKVPDRPSPPNSSIVPPLYVGHRPSPPKNIKNIETTSNNEKITKTSSFSTTRTTSNVGATVAALAAVLAAAPTAAARPNSSSKKELLSVPNHRQNSRNNSSEGNNLLLSRSAPMLAAQNSTASTSYLRPFGGGGGQSSAISFHSSPISPSSSAISANIVGNDSSFSKTPLSSQPQGINVPFSSSSTSLRRSIRNEFDAFKRRSISELSLVLEVLKKTTNRTKWGGMPDDERRDCWGRGTTTDDEYYQINPVGGNRRFVGPAESSSGSISAVNSLRRSGLPPPHHHSTGNLATSFSRKNQRRMALRRKIQWERLSPAAIQRQIVQVQEEKAMLQAPTAPISAAKFVAYVQERRKKRILFKGEFLMIQRSVDPQRLTTEVGIRMGEKNQYPDTLPYDQNRVILEHRPGVEDSHYINASYVNSWLRERAYVVTQSVRNKQASNELWRCVWEIGANTIVMLTKIFDFMRVVCLQYWPQTQFQFGEIHVETLDTRTYAHFVIRTFRLRKTGGVGDLTTTSKDGKGETQKNINDNNNFEERIVKHFHFTEWELNSFPYISAFVEVRRRVRQWMERSPVDAPIVVHCSNGGGRSGAFLAVDANLELLQRTGQLDVFEYARTLINSRQNLISSVEQYTFIYDVLCEAVLCNVQPMAMHQLKDRSTMYKARKNRELMELQDSHENKLLTMLTAPLRIGDCAGGHRLENRGKNRDVMVVPPDHARPYLQTLHGESKDYTYINAVEVDGFTRKAEFIVTEWPKQQTLDSFWTLVFDHNVHTVICLTNQPTDTKARNTFPPFVHNKGKKNYGPFTIEVVNFQQYPGLCSYMVKLSKRPTNAPMPLLMPVEKPVGNKKLTFMISEIMATGASQQQLEAEVRLCCIIQVKMWPIENKVPLSTTALIEVLKMTRSWRKRAPDRPESRPTIVMSHNGVSRCGIFIAANVLIDQMEMDHEVDVFHAVKLIRLNRPQLIDGPRTRFTGDAKDEYKYLYDLMLHWYMTNPELRSFEPPEADSLGSDEGSSDESIGEAQSLGTNRRSVRSGNRRRRSIQRSKSSRASRRTTTTANSLIHGGTEITQKNSIETSNEQKKRMEPVYLN